MNPKFKIYSYSFDQGIYQDVAELADSINESSDIADHQLIEKELRNDGYWRVQRVCSCTTPHRTYFNSKVFKVFGFSDQEKDSYGNPFIETTESKTAVKAVHPSCIARALPDQLFIYSDICIPYNVGDTKASLLRILCLNTKNYTYGTTNVYRFAPVHYIPLLNNSFQNITIDIRDVYGERIAFEYGTSTITLHFKRLQP